MWRFLYHIKEHIFPINVLKLEHEIHSNYGVIYDKVAYVRKTQNSLFTVQWENLNWNFASNMKTNRAMQLKF